MPSATLTAALGPLITKIQDIDRALDELQILISAQRASVLKQFQGITLLTRRQAAECLAMSESQVDRETRTGALTRIMVDRRPRYAPEDIKAFIDSRRCHA